MIGTTKEIIRDLLAYHGEDLYMAIDLWTIDDVAEILNDIDPDNLYPYNQLTKDDFVLILERAYSSATSDSPLSWDSISSEIQYYVYNKYLKERQE
jgi:hypothetical protein